MISSEKPVLSQTINELVEKQPAVLRVLGRYGIDTCCGGARTLEEAARAQGLEPGRIAAEVMTLLGDRPD